LKLKDVVPENSNMILVSERVPLKQGLKQTEYPPTGTEENVSERVPLKQGLKRFVPVKSIVVFASSQREFH